MKKQIIVLVLCFLLTGCSSAKWDYSGELAPETWGDISDEYKVCKNGQMQSPIDLELSESKNIDDNLKFNYEQADFKFVDNGKTLSLINKNKNSKLIYHDQEYQLEEIHFHNQSENTISQVTYPLEAHLVHKNLNDKNQKLIVSIMFELGDANQTIGNIFTDMNKSINLNPTDFIPDIKSHFEYNGSLDTPPCTEGVVWIVFDHAQPISGEQISAFTDHYQNNSRPVQGLNNRQIYYIQ